MGSGDEGKPLVKPGQSGVALYKKKGASWWPVRSPNDDWRSGGHGAYAPFAAILASDAQSVFPNIKVPDGTVVEVEVRIIKVGKEKD